MLEEIMKSKTKSLTIPKLAIIMLSTLFIVCVSIGMSIALFAPNETSASPVFAEQNFEQTANQTDKQTNEQTHDEAAKQTGEQTIEQNTQYTDKQSVEQLVESADRKQC